MILASTPHGVVSWAGSPGAHMGGPRGLWLLDEKDQWQQLVQPGEMPITVVDGSAAVYDGKRDCLWFGTNGGYRKRSDGQLHRFDFKSGQTSVVQPANAKLGQIGFFRETVYLSHCDWILNIDVRRTDAEDKSSPICDRVYDCANNRWMLVQFGPETAKVQGVGQGLVYDEKRELVYSIQRDGRVWALKVDAGKVKVAAGN
jgi:hypothetical protein